MTSSQTHKSGDLRGQTSSPEYHPATRSVGPIWPSFVRFLTQILFYGVNVMECVTSPDFTDDIFVGPAKDFE